MTGSWLGVMANQWKHETVDDWGHGENIMLRMLAADLVNKWSRAAGVVHPYPSDYLGRVMGYRDYNGLITNWSNEERRKLQLLIGPHGYTVYKTMLARKEV